MADDKAKIENENVEDVNEKSTDEPIEEERFTKADVEQRVAGRLAKHSRQEAELRAELAELRQKIQQGTPNANEVAQHRGVQQTQAAAQAQGMSQADIEKLAQHRLNEMQRLQSHNDFVEKLTAAAKEDPEFAQLVSAEGNTANKPNYIPPEALYLFKHLDNAAAVIKHLKKDKKDWTAMDTVGSPHEAIKFLNSLSERLESQTRPPGPSEFTPPPDLSDIGNSNQESFDAASYMRSKF